MTPVGLRLHGEQSSAGCTPRYGNVHSTGLFALCPLQSLFFEEEGFRCPTLCKVAHSGAGGGAHLLTSHSVILLICLSSRHFQQNDNQSRITNMIKKSEACHERSV